MSAGVAGPIYFLWGASAMAALVAGLFFMRFWRQTRDRFFLVFGLAFWALCLNWVGLAATSGGDESRTYFYLVRLAAFVLILAGVADRNRAPRKTLK